MSCREEEQQREEEEDEDEEEEEREEEEEEEEVGDRMSYYAAVYATAGVQAECLPPSLVRFTTWCPGYSRYQGQPRWRHTLANMFSHSPVHFAWPII